MKEKKDYRKLSERLLTLLFKLKHNGRSGYQDMVMRTDEGKSLDRLLKSEHRYEWRKVGATEHLFDLGAHPPTSVAYLCAESPRKVAWHVLGRQYFNGKATSVKEAKNKVEFHFEVISAEE